MTFEGPFKPKLLYNPTIWGTKDDYISPITHADTLTGKIRSIFEKQTNEKHFNNLIMDFELTAIKWSTDKREREHDVHCQIHQHLGMLSIFLKSPAS